MKDLTLNPEEEKVSQLLNGMVREKVIPVIEERVFKILIQENYMFSSLENLRSYFKLNFDTIINLYKKIVPNHVIFLEVVEVDKVSIEELTCIETLVNMGAIEELDEVLDLLSPSELSLFSKIFHSTLYFLDKEKLIETFIVTAYHYGEKPNISFFKKIFLGDL
jgi:Lhr-like helicase